MNRWLIVLLVGVAALSLCAGPVWISPAALWGNGPDSWIITQLRGPRVVLALAIGATLGLSGAVLQGLVRNPLADASVLGVSSGACLGAVTALYFGIGERFGLALPLATMAGALASLALLMAALQGRQSQLHFLLTGLMLGSITAALTTLVIALSPSPYALSEIITWLMGALTDRSWADVVFAVPLMAIGIMVLLRTGPALDGLALGEDTARTLGVSPQRTRVLILLGVGVSVGAAVSVSGVIGFVGLIVPHIARQLVGARPSALLWPSALGGALFLAAADLAVRLIPTATELRLGVVMALIGAPMFFLILRRSEGRAP